MKSIKKLSIFRYDLKMKSRILELISSGYSLPETAKLIGVSYHSLMRWRKLDKSLKPLMKKAKSDGMNRAINVGLYKLAKGLKVEDYTIEYTEVRKDRFNEIIRDIDGNPSIQKVRKTTHNLAPNVKAIEILARKYAKEFVKSDDDRGEVMLNLTLDTGGMSIRELQELNTKSNPLDKECIEAEYTNVKDAIRLLGGTTGDAKDA